MKTIFGTLKAILGVAVIAAFFVPLIHCAGVGSAQAAAEAPGQEPIVGFWKVTLTSDGTLDDPPAGVVLDSAYAQWHSDGTEISNSSRPPATQSFCLGVWGIAGPLQYKLNHFAISWNAPGSSPSDLLGPTNIRETITLNPDHNTFAGTFTIDQYDPLGNPLAHLAGTIQGKRITLDTTITDVL